jgi:hypothetical protein
VTEKETIKEITNPTEQSCLIYSRTEQRGFQDGVKEYFEIKDETSKKAFETFQKLRKEVQK